MKVSPPSHFRWQLRGFVLSWGWGIIKQGFFLCTYGELYQHYPGDTERENLFLIPGDFLTVSSGLQAYSGYSIFTKISVKDQTGAGGLMPHDW